MKKFTKKLFFVLLFSISGLVMFAGGPVNNESVHITNKTGFTISGHLNYVSGGLTCKKDYEFTVDPGEVYTGPDYPCLISSITGTFRVATGVGLKCPPPPANASQADKAKYTMAAFGGPCPVDKVLGLVYETKNCISYNPSSSAYKDYEIVQDGEEIKIIRVGGGWMSWTQSKPKRELIM